MGEFADKVFDIVRQVPKGKVATYGQVARLVGAPRSARYVGYALRANPAPGTDPDSIPCHRIVFKDGSLCKGFAFGGPSVQYTRLLEEGVSFYEVEPESSAVPSTRGTFTLEQDGVERKYDLDTLRVDMDTCQWDGQVSNPDQDGPFGPPSDFDWAAELGEL